MMHLKLIIGLYCVASVLVTHVDIDSVDVVRLLMAYPQVQAWSVGVTWKSQYMSIYYCIYVLYVINICILSLIHKEAEVRFISEEYFYGNKTTFRSFTQINS